MPSFEGRRCARPFERDRKVRFPGEVARVWINQTETVEVEHNVIRLYCNNVVRTSFEKVVSPLERDGIDDFGIVMNGQKVLDIHAGDVPSLNAGVIEVYAEVASDMTGRTLLQIESLTCFNRACYRFGSW